MSESEKVDALTCGDDKVQQCVALTEYMRAYRLLCRWYDWARAHGHLSEGPGLAQDTRDLLGGK